MMDENTLDIMDLPLANLNEELETISEHNFKPLFDPSQFEFCSKENRDKGIDYTFEIKKNGKHTGFRFVVQLKATKSIKVNTDGSFSLQINTSNINYLLNNSSPAFYILYCFTNKTFYYESLIELLNVLLAKDSDWTKQQSHVVRFYKELIPHGINEIYKSSLKNGLSQRNIKEQSVMIASSINTGDKIIIDGNMNVTNDIEIRKLIEGIGLELINEGKWNEIIAVHKKATGNIGSSALYNLILGIANYYSGYRWDAISFFKAADKLKSELSDELKMYLKYYDVNVKYSIGIIEEREYNKKLNELEYGETVRLHIKLEKAKQKYIKSINKTTKESFEDYLKDVEEVINDPKANKSIQLNGKCELILFEGLKNNLEYVKAVCIINAIEGEIGPNLRIRRDAALRFIQGNETWYKNLQALKKEASDTKNYFAYFIAISNEVKVSYEFEVCTDLLYIVQEIPGVPRPEMPDNRPMIDRMLQKITEAFNYFNQIGHVENVIATLSTKFEILHYLRDMNSAEKIMIELENLVDTYDLSDYKNRLKCLKNGGTVHETLKRLMDKTFSEVEAKKNEYEEIKAEMIRMDENERKIKDKPKNDNLHIHLFPIGYFQFPMNRKEKVYEILNINDVVVKNIFDKLFELAIPVANIYYDPIIKEGFLDGNHAECGIEGWRNIHRIRKSFYENKFYRFEGNIPG